MSRERFKVSIIIMLLIKIVLFLSELCKPKLVDFHKELKKYDLQLLKQFASQISCKKFGDVSFHITTF